MGQACTILNVEDDDALRYVRTRLLSRAGYQVQEATSGGEALALVRTLRPALVVLDIELGDVSGIDICKQIKQDPLTADTFVLQISAFHTSSQDQASGLECGADSYLTLPVTEDVFLASVQALMRVVRRQNEYQNVLEEIASQSPLPASLIETGAEADARQHIRLLGSSLIPEKNRAEQKPPESLGDELVQLLSVARLKLSRTSRDAASQNNVEGMQQTVHEVDTVLAQCLDCVRSLMCGLMPPVVNGDRFTQTLDALAAQMFEQGLMVAVHPAKSSFTLPRETAITLLQCVRELLCDVEKHSGALTAEVTTSVNGNVLKIQVYDKGGGADFIPGTETAPPRLALSIVQQRMASVGGRLEIESVGASGMSTTLVLPYSPSPGP